MVCVERLPHAWSSTASMAMKGRQCFAALRMAGSSVCMQATRAALRRLPRELQARGRLDDIASDGMLAGPNVVAMAEMQSAVDVPVIASGGVTHAEDVARLAKAGLAGCIIGRALYEGTLTLVEALQAAHE